MQHLPSPLVPPLDDTQLLASLIAEASGQTVPEVLEGLSAEDACLGKYMRESFARWELEPHVWSDRLIEYYKAGESELMGYAVWNRRREKLEMREWIGNHLQSLPSSKILTVGDGAGFDSLFLANCGHDVIYSEEAESCIRFAKLLFEKAERPVQLVPDAFQVEPQSVDVIVCLDVLEHVPDPPAFVADLAARLKPGGRLIVHAPFFFVTWHNPTHLRANIRYSGALKTIYTRNGLRLIDGRTFWDPIVLVKDDSLKVRTRSAVHIAKLRFMGLLLATARVWNTPHNWLAARAMQERSAPSAQDQSVPSAQDRSAPAASDAPIQP